MDMTHRFESRAPFVCHSNHTCKSYINYCGAMHSNNDKSRYHEIMSWRSKACDTPSGMHGCSQSLSAAGIIQQEDPKQSLQLLVEVGERVLTIFKNGRIFNNGFQNFSQKGFLSSSSLLLSLVLSLKPPHKLLDRCKGRVKHQCLPPKLSNQRSRW